ncbi:MAG: SCP2 sterol-binding domain-containing protein [Gammaproteobacteria bacterium]|nr:SCP2 sterol-binding domain-containing protein [Gammaproteobacteria bacterium]
MIQINVLDVDFGIVTMMNNVLSKHNPSLPGILRLPVRLVPSSFQNRLFVSSLNRLFKQELLDDELDFLTGKKVSIHVKDAGIKITFSLVNHKIVCTHSADTDLTIEGTVYDFLLLASRREDPDTLFFNRRLKLNGNTELGLYVKNFLDGLDITERWKYLYKLSDKASRFAERIG